MVCVAAHQSCTEIHHETKPAGSINALFSITGGYQENLVAGGAGSIAQRVADDLGEAIRLTAPVRRIDGAIRSGERAAGEILARS